MNKGLEALERIAERMANKEPMIVRDYNAIEKDLKRLEEYEKTEYSALIDSHKKLLKEKKVNKKKLKALEIIKNKGVNVLNFIPHFIISKPEYDEYQYYLDNVEKYSFSAFVLTPEEFNLLKEVLL